MPSGPTWTVAVPEGAGYSSAVTASEPDELRIGPLSKVWLRRIGITSRFDLIASGVEETYVRLIEAGHEENRNLYYGLAPIVLDVHWIEAKEILRANPEIFKGDWCRPFSGDGFQDSGAATASISLRRPSQSTDRKPEGSAADLAMDRVVDPLDPCVLALGASSTEMG